MRGKLIVLDGPDGGGKTTQIQLLREALEREGWKVLTVREPGGTRVGERVRAILLDPALGEMGRRTELFLYMACRAQLVEERLAPAMDRGEVVLCDRFLSSSVVYQGIAGGLGMEEVIRVGEFCVGGVRPDLTVILDVDVETGTARRGARKADRVEAQAREYQEEVRLGFLALARSQPDRVRVVDARADAAQVQAAIWGLVKKIL
ncbi:MAG: dTMP kinase [Planctomycetes bacterium]|nr:dTMP kinase [Planctomycetota bacterium]